MLAVALVGGVLGSAAISSAQYNVQIHMGAECLVYPTSTNYDKTMNGFIINEHATNSSVYLCPIIRDNPDVAINEVRVAVQDNNNDPNKYVQCKVTCYEDNDYTTSSSGTGYEGNTNSPSTWTGYATITISAGDITEYNDGRCFLNCQVPDEDTGDLTSAVVSYQVDN
jgi:hypothetical protein